MTVRAVHDVKMHRKRVRNRVTSFSSACRTWAAPVAVNLFLGLLAIIPIWGLVLFAVNYPLADIGLTHRDPTENDGMQPWLVIVVPLWAVLLALWLPANVAMRRKRRTMKGGHYWTASLLLCLLPTATATPMSLIAGLW